MAPTETMNLVIAPDLAQDELPFLEHMGFKQNFSALPSIHQIQKSNGHRRPPLLDARPRGDVKSGNHQTKNNYTEDDRDDRSTLSSRRASSSTAHSNGSGGRSSTYLPQAGLSLGRVSKMQTSGTSPSRVMSVTEQELQAGRLTSFISRMKYLSDEGDNHEFTPGIYPSGGSLAGQRRMITAHAARVKNELELKYQAIPYYLDLDNYLDYAPGQHEKPSYNPLQIIRDRKNRPNSDRQVKILHSHILWQIPVSEVVQDMRWRYQCTKLKAQKLKRRQKKAGSVTNAPSDAAEVLPENQHSTHSTDNEASPAPARMSAPQNNGIPLFNNPFVTAKARTHSQASDGPTVYLPETSCGELIQRLRSSHGAVDSGLSEGANSSSSESRHSSFHDASEVDPLSQQQQPSSFRRQFCRNAASVADRMRGPNDHADPIRLGSQTDDDALKPLSKVRTNSSQSISMHSSRSSIPDIFNFDVGSSSSVSLGPDQASQSKASDAPPAPVVTVTSETGEQKVLDSLKRTPRAVNLGNLRPGSPQKGTSDLYQRGITAGANAADDSMNDPINICTFGSIRPGHADVRKAPWERAAHTTEEELEYHILLLRTALRREDLGCVRNRVCRKYIPQDACDSVSSQLKNEGVPHFLNYLSGVEHNVVNQQQILDADFASSLDALRVTTDRMVSEVNTTLNKQVREMSSRMEKITSVRNCGFFTNASYTFLEYVVLSLMWVIWCVVKLWRILCGGFHLVRGGCNMFVIA